MNLGSLFCKTACKHLVNAHNEGGELHQGLHGCLDSIREMYSLAHMGKGKTWDK